eukprot:IDg22280t1
MLLSRLRLQLHTAEGMELEALAPTGGRQGLKRDPGGSADSSFNLVGGVPVRPRFPAGACSKTTHLRLCLRQGV